MSVQVKLESLSFGYRKNAPLFDRVSASILPQQDTAERGYITVVMGASGTGKSTLLQLLLGELRPSAGHVALTPNDARVSYLSQDPVLFDHLSIRDNARYFARLRSTRSHFNAAVFEWAEHTLGLSDVLARDESVGTLSGGERQRIALLRSISTRPALLLLDEPCRGLDPAVRQEFLLYLRQLVDQFSISVIYVTHHAQEARLLADHLVFLLPESSRRTGLLEGPLRHFIDHPRHEAIARTFSDAPLNRLPVKLERGYITVLGTLYSATLAEGSVSTGVRAQEVFMLFGPSSVQWNRDHGIACRVVGRSGAYLLADPEYSKSASATVIGPPAEGRIHSFGVNGEVFLYFPDGSLIGRARVDSACKAADSLNPPSNVV